jgi:tetratricopeptide (TPR) repeat protein
MDDLKAFETYRTALETANENPRKALPIARDALRLSRSFRCLRIRCASLCGYCLTREGRLKDAERLFSAAYKATDGCSCCLPVLHRTSALLLSAQGKHSQAIARATLAVDNALGSYFQALCVLTRGTVYDNANDHRAAHAFLESVDYFPPHSAYHRLAMRNLGRTLTFGASADIDGAFKLWPKVEGFYKMLPKSSPDHAWFFWVEGGLFTRKAETLTGHPRRKYLADAKRSLIKAYRVFSRHDMIETTAVWSDLCAVQARLEKRKVKEIAQRYALPDEFSDVRDSVIVWAETKRCVTLDDLFSLLRALRDTVGCGPSLALDKEQERVPQEGLSKPP